MRLRSGNLDEEVVSADGTTCRTHLLSGLLALLCPTLTTASLCLTADLDVQFVGADGLAAHRSLCRGNGEGAVLGGRQNIGIGHRRRAADMAIGHLETRLRRRAGAHQHLQFFGDVACTEVLYIVRINRIAQPELLAYGHLLRSTACNLLGQSSKHGALQHEQHEECSHGTHCKSFIIA